jgi:hypothetical protein
MAKKWSELKARCAPETIARAARRTAMMLAAIELDDLRRARGISAEVLDDLLRERQPLPRMEGSFDPRVSTLRDVVEAMGGELRVTARFPDAEYELDYVGRTNGAAA